MTKKWTYTKNEDDFMGSENRIEDRSINPLIRNDKQLYQLTQGITRIANYMEEILRLVKADQEKMEKRLREEN